MKKMRRLFRILQKGLACAFLAFALTAIPVYALLGDINLDNRVTLADLSAIAQVLGSRSTDFQYSRPSDLSLDNKIDITDLAIAGRSYNARHIFHYVRQISNSANGVSHQDSCLDGLGRINSIWQNSAGIYFTRLDRYGNTLVDDVVLAGSNSTPVGIGCDEAGNAHLAWVRNSRLYQARFDRWGYPIIKPQIVYSQDVEASTYNGVDVSLDSQGNAYAFFKRDWHNIPTLLRIDASGDTDLAAHSLFGGEDNDNSIYHQIAIDPDDNIHLIWYGTEYPERIFYSRYTSGSAASINERVIGITGYDGSVNSTREPALGVDAQGNAYVLWHKYGTPNLLLENIGEDGNTIRDDFALFTQWAGNGYTPRPALAVDEESNLHLLALTGWGRSVSHSTYGTFTSLGNPLTAMRWIYYGYPMIVPKLLADSEGDVHITFRNSSTSGYPPCPENAFCYLGSAFRMEAYELSRSDLGVDAAHLSYEPLIARWNGTVTITTTVFNEGWVASPATTLLLALETPQGARLSEITQPVSSLSPHQTQNVQGISLAIPALPPQGMNDMEYLRLRLEVDASQTITETSEENNMVLIPILVQKLPTTTGLFLQVRDDTETVLGGSDSGIWVNVGTANLQGSTYSRLNIPVTDDVTVLSKEIPVNSTPDIYTVSWSAPGYAVPTPVQVTIQRNGSDPYVIDYSPGNTALLVTNRWGSLSGNISYEGNGLSDAAVRISGQGLSIETTTDKEGNFSPSTKAELGKLIPGEYAIRVVKQGYARLQESLKVQSLEALTFNRAMVPTLEAYVHGNVVNAFGNPIGGANVNACGSTTVTDGTGVFDLTVDASCTSVSISRSGYATEVEPLSLKAGLEALLPDVEMTFDPPLTTFSSHDRVGSYVIDQSSGGLLPEPPDDASWVEKQIYEQFKSKFWAEYRVVIVYGAYEYNAAAAYSGPADDRRANQIQVRFDPKTFEVHMLLGSISISGAPISLPLVSDSGEKSAIMVIEARMVNTRTGDVIKTVYNPVEGSASELVLDDTILTYDFNSQAVTDWDNTELWLYYKVGKNVGGVFTSMPQLYQHDRQIMKFDLSSGTLWIDYGLGDFPLP